MGKVVPLEEFTVWKKQSSLSAASKLGGHGGGLLDLVIRVEKLDFFF